MIGAGGFMVAPLLQEALVKGEPVLCGGCYEKTIPYWGLPYPANQCLCDECMDAINEMLSDGTV